MLPTNSLQSTRLNVEDTLQPVRPTTQVLDVLSEFVPGQKLIAQIQFQLANGAYRASIAQRDVTLALPFSAKPGDALELEVVETEGRIAFAVSKQPEEGGGEKPPPLSASTTLSRTGQLIGRLLQEDTPDQQRPAPLNAGKPILETPPASSNQIAPALQQAVSRSGLFYESHQAAWLAGRFPEQALRMEPQALAGQSGLQKFAANATLPSAAPAAFSTSSQPGAQLTGMPPSQEGTPAPFLSVNTGPTPLHKSDAQNVTLANAEQARAASDAANTEAGSTTNRVRSTPATEVTTIVQQQLSSLANNVYPFQGTLWPGQQIQWEIVDEDGQRDTPSDEAPRQWKTRLKLLLPSLGDIDATIQLDGNDISVQMRSSETDTRRILKSDTESLRNRLELAGLRLLTLDVGPQDVEQRHRPEA